MSQSHLARAVALAALGTCMTLPSLAQAEFIKDSKASLELRNFYMNRDLRSTTSAQQSKREEWAQGFIFKAESGFTEGTVGFGLDAYAGLGLKLDSSGDSRLLPQVFNGAMLTSQEIAGLTLNGGQLREVNFRNSTDSQDITASN